MSRPTIATMIAQITIEPSMQTALPHGAIECSHFLREPKPHQAIAICYYRIIITFDCQSCPPLLHPSFSLVVPQCPRPRKPRRPVPGELNPSYRPRSQVNAKEWPALASTAKPGDKKDATAHGNKPFSVGSSAGKGQSKQQGSSRGTSKAPISFLTGKGQLRQKLLSDRSSNKPSTDSSAKEQPKQAAAKMNKKMKTVLGKPSGKAAPSGQPKSPIKKDLLLPDPSSPTNVSSSNKRVQVASPTAETPRPSSPSGPNSNAMSNSPHSPLPKHALSSSKVVKKFSPNLPTLSIAEACIVLL
eukprot:scaffold3390_cov61-Cyclotella_meneghiniana.AAC.12